MNKFLGLGLTNIVGLFLLFLLMIVMTKVLVMKVNAPEGVKNFVQAV